MRAAKQPRGAPVQFEDLGIAFSDQEQRGSGYARQAVGGEVGAPATRDDRSDSVICASGSPQSRRRAGRGAEVADREGASVGLGERPAGRLVEAAREERDVEYA